VKGAPENPINECGREGLCAFSGWLINEFQALSILDACQAGTSAARRIGFGSWGLLPRIFQEEAHRFHETRMSEKMIAGIDPRRRTA